MKLPDLDPTGGELILSEILIEYDGPQLFVARNSGGALFLALHGPGDSQVDNWLLLRVTTRRINQLKRLEITLREAFVHGTKGPAVIAAYRDERLIDYSYVEAADIPEALLPDEDSYLGAPDELSKDLISVMESSPKSVYLDKIEESLPVHTDVPLWEFDNQTIEYFKSRMTPLNIIASRRARLVADIVFSKPDDHTYFPVPELGKILINLQKTLDSLGADDGQKTSTGRPTAALKRMTRLDAVATFPSSFGLRVEAHEGSLIGGAESEVAFRRFVDLLGSIVDQKVMREVFSRHTVETKLFFGEVIKEVAKAGSSIRVSAGSAYDKAIEHASVPAAIVARIAKEINEINSLNLVELQFEGRLKAVSLKSKFFLIENEDESRSGRISDELMPQMSGAEINAFYRVKIVEKTIVHDVTGEIASKDTLIGLEKLMSADD